MSQREDDDFNEARARLQSLHQVAIATATAAHREATHDAMEMQKSRVSSLSEISHGLKAKQAAGAPQPVDGEEPEDLAARVAEFAALPDRIAETEQALREAEQPLDHAAERADLDRAVRAADAAYHEGLLQLAADRQLRHARTAVTNLPVGGTREGN